MFLKHKWRSLHVIVKHLKNRSKPTPPAIKIEATNGRHREFDAPILVDDVLAEYPGYAIFASDNRSTPLKGSELLQPGKVYFVSHPRRRHNSGDGSGSKHGLGRSKSHAHEGSRHVWFASRPSYIETTGGGGEDGSVGEATDAEVSRGGSEENATRVRVVLSKHEYEQLVRHGEDGGVEAVLKPLLEEFRLRRSVSAPHPSFSA